MGTTSPTRRRLARAVHALLGVLLLAAAGLKLYGLNVAPFARYGWLTAPWVQMLAVEWEIVLGLWLVSGVYRTGAWLAAVGTFAAFAAVSGYLGWIGQASCGCFGVIRASPWHAFAVDVAALVLLGLARPDWRVMRDTPRAEWLRVSTGFAGVLLGAGLILGVLAGAATLVYGSPKAAVARLRGEVLTTNPGYLDFGESEPRQVLKRTIRVRNWSAHPVRLIGGTSDCSCILTDNLPVTIPPGQQAEVTVVLKVPAGRGHLTRAAFLLTDCPQQRVVALRVGGIVLAADPGKQSRD